MDPAKRQNGWNGQVVKWMLGVGAGLVTAIALASGGTAIKVWAQTATNTTAVKECKNKLDAHCKKQETLDGDIRVIKRDVEAIKEDQAETKLAVKDILKELRKR